MIDPKDDNPDRSQQYKLKKNSPAAVVVNTRTGEEQLLVDQVNENWRQLRLFKAALSDRDEVISKLHESIRERDKLNKSLNTRLSLMNKVKPWLYGLFGGAAGKLGELLVIRLFHH
jgi:hypothetical protein